MIDRLNAALRGRYRVEELVERGGMATVYRAVDLRHERVVAIKVMNPEFAETVGRDRFLREIRVTAGLSHPHILPLFDSGDADGLLFYVMPFVEGMTLRQRLATREPLPLDDVRKIVREVADALSYAANRGVVHRDIKPENILLADYSLDNERASWNTLVADFGIAGSTTTRGEQLTGTGIAVGSPQYMSPEQAFGDRVDQRTDVWSLGCVTYEMLEGRSLRGLPTFTRAGTTEAMTRAILRALAHDPDGRFADARDLADAIEDRPRRASNPAVRVLTLFGGGVLIAMAVALALGTWRHAPARRSGVTKDTLALALYDRGQANVKARTIREAFDAFSGAIERDSGFALAWAGLARSAQLAVVIGSPIPGRSPDSLVSLALAASRRAVTLDSTAAEVWLTRARVMETVEPTSRAAVLSDLKRALAADSMNGDAWFALARARDDLLDTTAARAAYERAVRLAPTNVEAITFFALHYHYADQPSPGIKWADSALAMDPTNVVARDAATILAIETNDPRAAEQHLLALERLTHGRNRVTPLTRAARLAASRGDIPAARRYARAAEQLVDSATLTTRESAMLGDAFSAAGDTARAYRWLAAYAPRNDLHFQLHLRRDPELAWILDARYSALLSR
jgi:tetratricopeptide (TPR) repeat protein/tRNA A-37 threonylcarbamoyl transferase component Bud32